MVATIANHESNVSFTTIMKLNVVALNQSKELLTPIAQKHAPDGSTAEAVLDQWLHAIATNSQLFCNKSIANPVDLKSEILSVLKTNNVYQNEPQFYELIFGSLARSHSAL